MLSKISQKSIKQIILKNIKPIVTIQRLTDQLNQEQQEEQSQISDIKIEKFAQHIQQLNDKFEVRQQLKQKYLRQIKSSSISSKVPLKDILRAFIASNKLGFDQQLTSEALLYLAATYKSMGLFPQHYYDYDYDELKSSWRFMELISDFKYGMKNGVVFSPDGLGKCIKALNLLNYNDIKLLNLALQKIQRQLLNQDNNFQIDMQNLLENNPCLHKPLYYNNKPLDLNQILKNEKFKTYLKATVQRYQQEIEKQENQQIQNEQFNQQRIQLQKQKNIDEEEEDLQTTFKEVEFIAKKMEKQVNKASTLLRNIITAVMKIRNYYLQFIEAQEQILDVNRNSMTNLDLLNLEELMLEAGLLTINEIKNPDLIKNQEKNIQQISQIVENIINSQNESFLPYFETLVQQKLLQIQQNQSQQVSNFDVQLEEQYSHLQFSQAFLEIAEYANKKGKQVQGETFLNEKWADFFTEEQSSNFEQVDRVFFKQFVLAQQYFIQFQEIVLNQCNQLNVSDPNVYANYADAYNKMGLLQTAEKFIQKINIENIQKLDINNVVKVLKVYVQYPQKYSLLTNNLLQRLYNEPLQTNDLIYVAFYEIYQGNVQPQTIERLRSQLEETDMQENPYLNFVCQYLQTQNIHLGFNSSGAQLFGMNLFPKNPVKDHIVELVGKKENLQSLNCKEYQPDFLTLVHDQDQNIVQKAIFLCGTDFGYFDTQQNSIEYAVLGKFLGKRIKNMQFEFINVLNYMILDKNGNIQINQNNDKFNQLIALSRNNIYQPLIDNLLQLSQTLSNEEKDIRFTYIKEKFLQIMKLTYGRKFLNASLSDLMHVKYLLYQLSLDYQQVLLEEERQQLDQLCQRFFNQSFLQLLKHYAQKKLSTNNSAEEISFSAKQQWVGKRLSIDVIQKQASNNNQNIELFFNHAFLNDQSYFDFPQWKNILTQQYGISNICQLAHTQNIISTTVAQAINNGSTGAFNIPKKLEVRSQIRPSEAQKKLRYSVNWEQEFFMKDREVPLYNGENSKVSFEAIYIANLLNFVHEVKKQFNNQQKIQLLNNFEFTDNIIQNHLGQTNNNQYSELKYATRDPNQYFNYLENKNQTASLYCQQYLEYFAQKAFTKNQIVQLAHANFQQIKELFRKYQNGTYSRQQFDQFKQLYQKQLLHYLRLFDQQNTKLNILLQGETNRYIDVQYDQKELIQDKLYVKYNLQKDRDYIMSGKDVEKCLKLKRIRVEEKLIKTNIISKIAQGIKLSTNENEYLKQWKNNSLKTPENPTNLQYGQLSNKDKETLSNFKFSALNEFEDMQVNDLVFEFVQYFDDSLINNTEVHFRAQKEFSEWGIVPELISKQTLNTKNNQIITLAEQQVWREGQKLSEYEKENTFKMLRILQEQGYNDKLFTQQEEVLRRQALEVINECDNRFELFINWLESRENENYSIMQENNKEFDEFWKKIFSQNYEQTTEDQIHIFIHYLVQRLFVISKFPPVKFSLFLSKVLTHKNINLIDKNILICLLDVFKYKPYLNSKELVDFIQNIQQIHPQQDYLQISQDVEGNSIQIVQKVVNYSQ